MDPFLTLDRAPYTTLTPSNSRRSPAITTKLPCCHLQRLPSMILILQPLAAPPPSLDILTHVGLPAPYARISPQPSATTNRHSRRAPNWSSFRCLQGRLCDQDVLCPIASCAPTVLYLKPRGRTLQRRVSHPTTPVVLQEELSTHQ